MNSSATQIPIDLQQRDLWILEDTAKMRFVQASDHAKLHFDGSVDASTKRLRKLGKAGLLKVWEKAYGQKHVYTITRAGLHMIAKHGGDDLSYITPPKQLNEKLEHAALINQCRIALALELPKAGGELAWWRSDWELRAMRQEPVIPDAAFRIAWTSGESQACALEVECQTRDPQKFLQKILAYSPYQQLPKELYGLSDFTLLLVCQREQQMNRYRQESNVLQTTNWMWFTTIEAITRTSGLIPIWQPAAGGPLQSLQELATTPSGRPEGVGLVTEANTDT